MNQVEFFADKRHSFLQVSAILFGGHAQNTQNNKFEISLQYFKK